MPSMVSYELLRTLITIDGGLLEEFYNIGDYAQKGTICSFTFNVDLGTSFVKANETNKNKVLGILYENANTNEKKPIITCGKALVNLLDNSNPILGDKIRVSTTDGLGMITTKTDYSNGLIGIVTETVSHNQAIVYLTLKNDMYNFMY